DLDAEHLLDRDLHFGLVRTGVNLKGVLALIHQGVALLRDDRLDQDVPGVLVERGHLDSSASVAADSDSVATALADLPVAGPATNASSAPLVKMMSSWMSTSYVFSWST